MHRKDTRKDAVTLETTRFVHQIAVEQEGRKEIARDAALSSLA